MSFLLLLGVGIAFSSPLPEDEPELDSNSSSETRPSYEVPDALQEFEDFMTADEDYRKLFDVFVQFYIQAERELQNKSGASMETKKIAFVSRQRIKKFFQMLRNYHNLYMYQTTGEIDYFPEEEDEEE